MGVNKLLGRIPAQPVPVVPDAIPVSRDIDAGYLSGWNDCRAAMLQAVPLTNEGTSLQDNHSVDDTEKVNSPAIPEGYVMVPREPTKQMILAGQEELESCIDNGFDSDIDGNRYDYTDIVPDAPRRVFMAMLAAAPQPQNAPQNIPEIIPDCWCRTCRPVVLNDMRFVVCPDCGNKRCPRANDHRNACTGSNEPGQEGSAYPDIPREVK